jgi:SAM-dependent methyltransferase
MSRPPLWKVVLCLWRPTAWRLLPSLLRQRQPIRYLPLYLTHRREFIAKGGRIDRPFPILYDYADQAGSARGHYFHQDLLVASLIHEAKPVRHIDVGSRIDGFVAHVATFREIEIVDVRPLKDCGHRNIRFLRADLMDEQNAPHEVADSVSCLHAIEHFGLGRYTDPLVPDGHLKGFANLVRMLKPGGTLYISFPIATHSHTCFNAHRVFEPKEILSWPTPGCRLELLRFDHVDDAGDLHREVDLHTTAIADSYGCGIYVFRKSLA